jgi:RimJ/RimL family protein N-acetyltransferase
MHPEIRSVPQLPPSESAPIAPKADAARSNDSGCRSDRILRTHRLSLRHLTLADAPFILSLVNDASWLRFIGDRNVHSQEDAVRYIKDGPFAMHAKHGYSLWAVSLAESDSAIGLCGLLKRDCLPHADLGFAFLPQWRGQGYAREAAAATLHYGCSVLGMKRIFAVTAIDNERCIRYTRAAAVISAHWFMMLQVAEERRYARGGARATSGRSRRVQIICMGAWSIN